MSARSIVTSQPDVACDVCERRLLRGENPDIFLAAGRRRIVCELCAPRAVHEGWRREGEGGELELSPARPRRGRNLFERLKGVSRSTADAAYDPSEQPLAPGEEPPPFEAQPPLGEVEDQPYDFLGEIPSRRATATPAPADGYAVEPLDAPAPIPTSAELAVATFNASEFPRRIAGIARSLGAPSVNVAPPRDAVGERIAIVVAWELCWYRYEVDLDEEQPQARLIAQGTELDELARGERVANTLAHESGALSAPA